MCRSSFPNFKIFVVIFSGIDVTFVVSVLPKVKVDTDFLTIVNTFFGELYFLLHCIFYGGLGLGTQPILFWQAIFEKSKSLRIGWLLSLLKMLLLQIEKRCLLLQGSPSVPPEKFLFLCILIKVKTSTIEY